MGGTFLKSFMTHIFILPLCLINLPAYKISKFCSTVFKQPLASATLSPDPSYAKYFFFNLCTCFQFRSFFGVLVGFLDFLFFYKPRFQLSPQS